MNENISTKDIYSFDSRPQDPNPQIIITKIDNGGPKGEIFHTYIQGVKVKTSLSSNGYSDYIIHLPFSKEALDASNIKLIGYVKTLPNFQDGYKIWLESIEKGKGSVFRIPIKEALNFLEQRLN